MNAKRLFVTYGGAHAHILAPIISAFEARQPGSTLVLALTGAAIILRDQYQIDCVQAKDFPEGLTELERRSAEKIIDDMRAKGQPVLDHEESVSYLAYGLQGLVRSGLSAEAAIDKVLSKGRSVLWPIGLVEQLFNQNELTLVVTTNSPRAEKAAQNLAAEREIASAVIPDLFGMFEHYPFSADKVFVMTAQAKSNLIIKYGVNEGKIEVTGNPYYEQAAIEISDNAQTSNDKIFAWFEQNGFYDCLSSRHVFRSISDLKKTLGVLLPACEENGYKLVARRHPSQDAQQFARACSDVSEKIMIDESTSAHELVSLSSQCGSTASTVLMQAVSAGRPVIQILEGVEPAIDLRGILLARTVAEKSSHISSAIRSLESVKGESHDPLNSRGATARIIDSLLKLESHH